MEEFDSQDALFETLMIEKLFELAKSPPMGGYNSAHILWQGYCWRVDGHDIAYRNNDNQYHRLYGPAYISKNYDIEIWFKDGEYHRIGGPAIKHKNNFLWYQDGKLHNLNGPAIIDGGGPCQYWIEGRKYSPKEYKKEIARRRRRGLIK